MFSQKILERYLWCISWIKYSSNLYFTHRISEYDTIYIFICRTSWYV